MKNMFLILGTLALALPLHAEAKVGVTRIAKCEIVGDQGTYIGPCAFTPYEHGDFSVSGVKGRRFYGGAEDVYLSVIEPGLGDVSISYDPTHGRWGEARRSKEKPACWFFPDEMPHRICVY